VTLYLSYTKEKGQSQVLTQLEGALGSQWVLSGAFVFEGLARGTWVFLIRDCQLCIWFDGRFAEFRRETRNSPFHCGARPSMRCARLAHNDGDLFEDEDEDEDEDEEEEEEEEEACGWRALSFRCVAV
jgi:hypothetical protein